MFSHIVEDGPDEVEAVAGDGLVERRHPRAPLAVPRQQVHTRRRGRLGRPEVGVDRPGGFRNI